MAQMCTHFGEHQTLRMFSLWVGLITCVSSGKILASTKVTFPNYMLVAALPKFSPTSHKWAARRLVSGWTGLGQNNENFEN